MTMRCEQVWFSLPSGHLRGRTMQRLRDLRKHAKRVECEKPATRFYMPKHPKMLNSYPHGQHLCDEHYKDQMVMEDLFSRLDTPEGRRELFG